MISTGSVGCNLDSFTWCDSLKPINSTLFFFCYVFILGTGFASMNIALNTLFSKIIGPRRQVIFCIFRFKNCSCRFSLFFAAKKYFCSRKLNWFCSKLNKICSKNKVNPEKYLGNSTRFPTNVWRDGRYDWSSDDYFNVYFVRSSNGVELWAMRYTRNNLPLDFVLQVTI